MIWSLQCFQTSFCTNLIQHSVLKLPPFSICLLKDKLLLLFAKCYHSAFFCIMCFWRHNLYVFRVLIPGSTYIFIFTSQNAKGMNHFRGFVFLGYFWLRDWYLIQSWIKAVSSSMFPSLSIKTHLQHICPDENKYQGKALDLSGPPLCLLRNYAGWGQRNTHWGEHLPCMGWPGFDPGILYGRACQE